MLRKNRKALQMSLDVMEKDIDALKQKLNKPNFGLALTTNDMRVLMVSIMSYLLTDLSSEDRLKASNIYQELGEAVYGNIYGFSDYEQDSEQEQI